MSMQWWEALTSELRNAWPQMRSIVTGLEERNRGYPILEFLKKKKKNPIPLVVWSSCLRSPVINVPELPQYKMASIYTIDPTFSTPKMNDRDINNFNLVGLITLQVLLFFHRSECYYLLAWLFKSTREKKKIKFASTNLFLH